MRLFLPFLTEIARAPEDGAGAGSFFSPGEEGPAPSPTPPGESSPPAEARAAGGDAPPANEGQPPAEGGDNRPDWLLPKYKSVEDQAKAYNDMFRNFSKKTEDLRKDVLADAVKEYGKTVGVPDDPQDYAYPEGWTPPDEEVDATLRQWAKDHNISPEGFQKLIGEVWAKTQPDPVAEMALLGDQAQERISSVNRWLTKNLDEKHYGTLQRLMTTAGGVELIESLMELTGEAGFSPDAGRAAGPTLTREAIRTMQADPKFGADEAYTAKVRGLWKQYAALPKEKQI